MTTTNETINLVNIIDRINKDFLNGDITPITGGGGWINDDGTINYTNMNRMNNKYDPSFVSNVLSPAVRVSYTDTQFTTNTSVVYVRFKNNPSSNVSVQPTELNRTLMETVNGTSNLKNNILDINVTPLLAPASAAALNLTNLYVAHDMCLNWESYRKNKNMSLKKNTVNPSGRNDTVQYDWTNASAMTDFNKKMFNVKEFMGNPSYNMFALKALIYVYIRLLSFNVSMNLVQSVSTTPRSVNNAQVTVSIASALPAAYIYLMSREIGTLDAMISRINADMSTRKQRYQDLNTNINAIHDRLDTNRSSISTNQERLRTEKSYEKRVNIYSYTSLGFVIAILVGVVLIQVVPMEYRIKLASAGSVLGLASIFALVMWILQSKTVVEGFDTSGYINSSFAPTVGNISNWENLKDIYSRQMITLCAIYLEKVALLIHTISTFNTYKDVTYTMSKEIRYFTDTNSQMEIANEQLYGVHRVSDLTQKQKMAMTNLFIVIGIVVGLAILGHVGTEKKFTTMQPIILGVAGFVILIAVVIFIMQYTGFVRTDGDKKYWGQPVNTSFM